MRTQLFENIDKPVSISDEQFRVLTDWIAYGLFDMFFEGEVRISYDQTIKIAAIQMLILQATTIRSVTGADLKDGYDVMASCIDETEFGILIECEDLSPILLF